MRPDRDPPRLADMPSADDALLRSALRAARDDLPGESAVARLAARLPGGPGGGPDGEDGPHGGSDASGAVDGGANGAHGAAGATGAAPSATPLLSSIAIGAAAGVVASFLLWLWAPPFLEPPPAPAIAMSAPTATLGPTESKEGDRPVPVPAVSASSTAAPARAAAVSASAPAEVAPSPADTATATQAAGAAPEATATASEAEGESEASLLSRAQAQLGSNPGGALMLTEQARSRFPKGNLGQEREFIAISALVGLGRTAEARARAEAMIAANPNTAHRRRLSAVVPGIAAEP